MTSTFPHWPRHDRDELDAVRAVLESGRTNQWTGPDVADFEAALADTFQVPHVLATSSGTSALETALRGLGIGRGDEVLVPARSFIATASAVLTVGATVRFADVDPWSGNVTVDTLDASRTSKTRCVVVMHHGGWPCDMPAITSWARGHGLLIVEDCAQAHGARIDGAHVGAFGDAAAFSFCQDKIITTGGEGGCAVFLAPESFARGWSWRDHGKSPERLVEPRTHSGFNWMVESIGTNVRMTGMQAAIGIVQLTKLARWHDERKANARMLRDRLDGLDAIEVPWPEPSLEHAWYVLHALVEADLRDEVLDRLRDHSWPVRSGVCPELHREAVFGGSPPSDTPMAADYGRRSLMLPVHPAATADDMHRLADAVRDAVTQGRSRKATMSAAGESDRAGDRTEQLIGRRSVDPVESLMQRPVRGRVVLVTGAGGSIGGELCRQIALLAPKRLIMLDRNEFGLYEIDLELDESVARRAVLSDIRDEASCHTLLADEGVQTVFHAAAYKHVPLVERNVVEAIENNALGTRSILSAAAKAGVEQFVLVSSDKAVRPTSIMGASKRLSEMIVQADTSAMRTCIVRFGNVLESSGSVVPLFRKQIAQGGPVTVTDAAMVRYFMTIPEAAQLVIQAGGLARDGEVLLLDMGRPVNIAELAATMIRRAGRTPRTDGNPGGEIAIEITGTRPGEKIREELLIGDDALATEHPMIARAIEPAPDLDELALHMSRIDAAIARRDGEATRALVLEVTTCAAAVG